VGARCCGGENAIDVADTALEGGDETVVGEVMTGTVAEVTGGRYM
jgi:hypothetical protein